MVFRLPRLQISVRIVTDKGTPSPEYQRWWQQFADAIERQELAQDTLLAAIVAAQQAADDAQAAADAADIAAAAAQVAADDAAGAADDAAAAAVGAAADAAVAFDAAGDAATDAAAAQASAVAAQDTADDVGTYADLNLSFASGLSLSATDAGTDASIVISSHTRIYQSSASVAVTGTTLTGKAYSTAYAIYYDDAARTGGAVTYVATTTFATAQASFATPNRHYVGTVITPAALGADIDGAPVVPASFVFENPQGIVF